MTIRTMTIDDYERVYALWTDAGDMGMRSMDDARDGIERYLARNPHTSFVAEENGALIGAILCGHDGRRGYIYHAKVNDKRRGGGVGRVLVQAAVDALMKEGIHKVALVAFRSNEKGNAFWAALGFGERADLVYRDFSLNAGNV